jgi:hypothetical protein
MPGGSHRGEIPGSFTRSTRGFTMAWFVTALDAEGAVVTRFGSAEAPRLLEVAPGSALAMDLKANERLPQPNRLLSAFAGGSLAAAAPGLGGVVDPPDVTATATLGALAAVPYMVGMALAGDDGGPAAVLSRTDAGLAGHAIRAGAFAAALAGVVPFLLVVRDAPPE